MKAISYCRHWFSPVARTALLLGLFPFGSAQAAETAWLSPNPGAGFYAEWVNSGGVVNEAVGCYTPIANTAWRGDVINTRNSASISIPATVPNGATIDSVDVQVCQQRAAVGVDGATSQTFIRVDGTNTDSGINILAATPFGSPVASIQNILAGSIVKSNATTLEVGAVRTNGTVAHRVETIAAKIYFTLPGSTTTVSCTSPIAIGTSSSCTATVAPTAGGNTPTGTVSWTTTDSGSFSSESCAPGTGELVCSATFTPSGVGTPTLTATYAGDTNMTGSNDDQLVTVNTVASTTTVSCDSPVTIGSDSSCTATVAPVAGSTSPTGTVSWTTTDSGSFSSESCASGTGSLSCSATFTPSGVGAPTVTATYAGDSNTIASDGTDDVQVDALPPPPAPASIPVFGPVALLLTVLGMGLVGGWQTRRRS